MHEPEGIRGLLLDLDGVCYVDGAAIPGALDALDRLRAAGFPLRFLTNTTTRSRSQLVERLAGMGIEVASEHLFTAPVAAAGYLRSHDALPVHPVVRENVLEDFAGCPIDRDAPKSVLIGDIGDAWSHALLDRLFRQVSAGAALVALHKGRSWQTGGDLGLDIGSYVAGLEYATGEEALVIGKPAPTFFLQALSDLGLPAEAVAVVGDDIDSDVGGGQAVGLTGILAHTGKYRRATAERSRVTPHHQIASLAELPDLLGC